MKKESKQMNVLDILLQSVANESSTSGSPPQLAVASTKKSIAKKKKVVRRAEPLKANEATDTHFLPKKESLRLTHHGRTDSELDVSDSTMKEYYLQLQTLQSEMLYYQQLIGTKSVFEESVTVPPSYEDFVAQKGKNKVLESALSLVSQSLTYLLQGEVKYQNLCSELQRLRIKRDEVANREEDEDEEEEEEDIGMRRRDVEAKEESRVAEEEFDVEAAAEDSDLYLSSEAETSLNLTVTPSKLYGNAASSAPAIALGSSSSDWLLASLGAVSSSPSSSRFNDQTFDSSPFRLLQSPSSPLCPADEKLGTMANGDGCRANDFFTSPTISTFDGNSECDRPKVRAALFPSPPFSYASWNKENTIDATTTQSTKGDYPKAKSPLSVDALYASQSPPL